MGKKRRKFNDSEHAIVYLAADGKCENCGKHLKAGWHADHITPYSKTGTTHIINGQALCADCNLKKGDRSMLYDQILLEHNPRRWQNEALVTYNAVSETKRDFLLVATPGAGKTFFSGMVIAQWLDAGRCDFVIVVAPTDHLRRQWATKMAELGFYFLPDWKNSDGVPPSDVQGLSITYQQVSSPVGREMLRRIVDRRRVGAILDEVHHAGESLTWGDNLRYIFESATYRLCLSGTPFRSDNNPIPFVAYDQTGRSLSEYNYGYGDALRDDKVVRYVFFPTHEGKMEWITSEGEELTATFNDYLSEQRASERLRTAIDPSAEWLPQVIREAHERLVSIRENGDIGDPCAGGLIICMDQRHAQSTAHLVKRITGTKPVVVISDMEAEASAEITRYAKSDTPWIIAVKMVSEGVDIPRLRVGVYATNVTTELFFRQAVGRVVRYQGKHDNSPEYSEIAYFYIPRDERLISFAHAIRDERDHVLLDEQDDYERDYLVVDTEREPGFSLFMPVSATSSQHNTIVLDNEITPDELAYARRIAESIGFGKTPEEVLAMAFRAAGVNIPKGKAAPVHQQDNSEQALFIRRKRLRTECNTLASRLSIATGEDHKAIHSQWVHQYGGMWQKNATIEDLERKREWLREQIRKLT